MTTKGRVKFSWVLFQSFLAILFFASCQKEITSEAVAAADSTGLTTSLKVKTYSEYSGSASNVVLADTFNLSYNANGRIVTIASVTPGNRLSYTYNSNNTFTLDIYVANTLSIHELFYLNSYSLVDSSLQSNGTPDTTTEKYIYNSGKQLITRKEYFYSGSFGSAPDINTTNYSYDNNGNAIKETTDRPSTTTTYTYYTDLVNNVSIGLTYFYQNKNLTKTTTYTSGGVTTSAQHTYTFDRSNRQTSEKIVADNGEVVIKNYTYY